MDENNHIYPIRSTVCRVSSVAVLAVCSKIQQIIRILPVMDLVLR